MKNQITRKYLPITCTLLTSLCTGQVLADWSGDKLHRGYNQRFGDFPPVDIDQQLSGNADTEKTPEKTAPQAAFPATFPATNQATNPATNPAANQTANPAQAYSQQSYSGQTSQQPVYNTYYQGQKTKPPGSQRYNRSTNFNGPWNNNRSSFSGPWNNRGSGFSGPWNNSGSGFSGPWNNNGSNFGGPWNNNGSNFSMPWGNKGKGGGWGW